MRPRDASIDPLVQLVLLALELLDPALKALDTIEHGALVGVQEQHPVMDRLLQAAHIRLDHLKCLLFSVVGKHVLPPNRLIKYNVITIK